RPAAGFADPPRPHHPQPTGIAAVTFPAPHTDALPLTLSLSPQAGRGNAAALLNLDTDTERCSLRLVRSPSPRVRGEGRGEGHLNRTTRARHVCRGSVSEGFTRWLDYG